jgi:hypothetical protein
MNTLTRNVSRGLSSAAFQILVAAALVATPWLSTVAIASEPASAVAQANKSASVSADSPSVELVNYDLFTQNEAATTQPPAAPPAQPLPKNPEAKPAPTGKGPAPPAATTNPESPATPTASPQPERVFSPPPASRQQSLFSLLQSPPGQRPFLNNRLSRTPDVFGDSFIPVSVKFDNPSFTDFAKADLPLGGGMRRFKNEHARALPTDRVFFLYNHFHNALRLETQNTSTTDNVDQFTFGFEKTSDDGQWSFELRMPFSGDANLSGDDVAVDSNGVGNLVGTLKRIMYSDSTFVVAAGLAVVAPTGSDASVTFQLTNSRIDFENEAVHLLPYLAVQASPDENWFFHAFAQVDIAANENEVSLVQPASTVSDSLAEQTLLYLDGSAGYWWYQSTDDSGLTGLASVVELHYTTTLNDADSANLGSGFIGNLDNRYDVLNLTAGVHSEWSGNTAIRFAVVVPLDRDERFFDSEMQVSIIRRY